MTRPRPVRIARPAAVALVSLGMLMPAVAQTLVIMPPEEMVRALLTKGGDDVAAAPAGGEKPVDPFVNLPGIDLTVDFEFDTHRLTEEGMLVLRAVGTALADPRLADRRFLVAAHTEDRGTEAEKLLLSKRRADAVANHLAAFYGIAPARLHPVGYGPIRLADPSDPQSARNRRVEIVNVAPLP